MAYSKNPFTGLLDKTVGTGDTVGGTTFGAADLTVTGNIIAQAVQTSTDYVAANAAEGDRGYSSTDKAHEQKDAIGNGLVVTSKESQIVDGATVTTPASETSMYASAYPIPANSVKAGRTIKGFLHGIVSTAASTPGTYTFKIKLGSVAVATIVTPTLPTSLSNEAWSIDFVLVCRTIGASGTFEGYAKMLFVNETTGAIRLADQGIGHNIVVDTTAAMDLGVTVTPTATTNSITARSRIITA